MDQFWKQAMNVSTALASDPLTEETGIVLTWFSHNHFRIYMPNALLLPSRHPI
jgi:hypothetical protein